MIDHPAIAEQADESVGRTSPAGNVPAVCINEGDRTMLEETGIAEFATRLSEPEPMIRAVTTDPKLRELHARYAVLWKERDELSIALDTALMEKTRTGGPDVRRDPLDDPRFQALARRAGATPLVERIIELNAQLDDVLDEIYETPIEALEDVAVQLDIAMGEYEFRLLDQAGDEDVQHRSPFMCRLFRELTQAVPGFEFMALRRLTPAERDNFLGIADIDGPEPVAVAAE